MLIFVLLQISFLILEGHIKLGLYSSRQVVSSDQRKTKKRSVIYRMTTNCDTHNWCDTIVRLFTLSSNLNQRWILKQAMTDAQVQEN